MSKPKYFNPSCTHLRAARAALGWDETTTTAKANISQDALKALEADPRGGVGLLALEFTYREAGIIFTRQIGHDGYIDGVSWVVPFKVPVMRMVS